MNSFGFLARKRLPTPARLLLGVVLLSALGGLANHARAAELQDRATYSDAVVPFLRQHCTACHGAEEAGAGLRLDTLEPDFLSPQSAGAWVEVMDQINLGQMPPEGEPRPEAERLRRVTSWIADELRFAEKRRSGAGRGVIMRRLNRFEVANTLRDLLHLQFLPGESPLDQLPPDGTAEGFDKVATALMLDPSLLEQYFQVASQVAQRAIVDGPPQYPTRRMRYELEETANNRAIDYLCANPAIECRENEIVLMADATRSFGVMKYGDTRDEIPTSGLYRIRVRAWGTPGAEGHPVRMRFRQDHPQDDQQLLLETEVTDQPTVYEAVVPRDPKCGEYHVEILNPARFRLTSSVGVQFRREQQEASAENDFATALRLQSRQQLESLTFSRPNPETADTGRLAKLYVDWIECEGPLYEQWPPRSHQQLLFRGEGATEDLDYATEIFRRFLPRAYRRPITDEDLQSVMAVVEAELAAGRSFHDAIRAGLTVTLCSPHFLFLIEPAGDDGGGDAHRNDAHRNDAHRDDEHGGDDAISDDQPGVPRRLNDWELATRLSYFLWSSMPDERLFDLAAAGRLHQPEVLLAEVDRMLADEKAAALIDSFAAQWLKTDAFLAFAPDQRTYRDYSPALGEAMVREPLAFFREVLQSNESLLSFVDSDWTMVNETLADFYGLSDVSGDAFRRVVLPDDSPRGGLLGMAGVALMGSDGVRTKPVHRGAYVRDVLFNDPPDPPPPGVGEVEPNIQGERLTVRQRLIQHQQIASCAACHLRIDCYGLALENFNVIGQWRTRQDGEDFRGDRTPPIDPSGVLPNGQAFDSFAEFKSLLLQRPERVARGLSEKMLTYALGRGIDARDRSTVDALVDQLVAEDYRLQTLIRGIVTSKPFQQK
ncbi:DUF1592 domain-containing protein [Roseimaritima sediminicola]|uniref:DUF1592 domain-containing protein n=1 Tax=Roseimaritima sediminicola TaxID=2662066 RepID=UPI001386C46B|nr:DUF1592 domain-containing protein [Roseimaritima sediminicola]